MHDIVSSVEHGPRSTTNAMQRCSAAVRRHVLLGSNSKHYGFMLRNYRFIAILNSVFADNFSLVGKSVPLTHTRMSGQD